MLTTLAGLAAVQLVPKRVIASPPSYSSGAKQMNNGQTENEYKEEACIRVCVCVFEREREVESA